MGLAQENATSKPKKLGLCLCGFDLLVSTLSVTTTNITLMVLKCLSELGEMHLSGDTHKESDLWEAITHSVRGYLSAGVPTDIIGR